MGELERCVGADRDFEVMGWPGATVHAIAVDWDSVVLEGGTSPPGRSPAAGAEADLGTRGGPSFATPGELPR